MPAGWVAAATIGSALIGGAASRSATSAASDSNAQALTSQEAATANRLAFDKQVYSDGAADRTFASDMARTTATNQAQDRTKYNALQDDQIARGKVYQGVEDTMLGDAKNYDTPDRRAQAESEAMQGVQSSIDTQRASSARALAARGVNPNSGASLALNGQLDLQGAVAKAGAANVARKNIETIGYARKMDAVGLGKGLVGNQATQAGLGLTAGNSSVANSVVPLNVSGAANSAMSAGYGNAAAGYGQLGSNQLATFNIASRYGAGVGQNVGSMFGQLANNPSVQSSIGNTWNRWMTPSNADTVIPMQPGGGY